MIAKSTIDVAKGMGKNTRTISISGIVPRSDNLQKRWMSMMNL